jgi:hypothetical protein
MKVGDVLLVILNVVKDLFQILRCAQNDNVVFMMVKERLVM